MLAGAANTSITKRKKNKLILKYLYSFNQITMFELIAIGTFAWVIVSTLYLLITTKNMKIEVGTKSVLYGAHCFIIHPWFVMAAWWKLYGFPWDPRLWIAFFVHDIGYWGKPNMDGPEGKKHVEFGAKIMGIFGKEWADFSMYHSRYYAKKNGAKPSRLCFADKLSFALTPAWLYLPMVTATGEINEYLKNAQKKNERGWVPTNFDKKKWHTQLAKYMIKWVNEHKDGREDSWTNPDRHAINPEGVWQ